MKISDERLEELIAKADQAVEYARTMLKCEPTLEFDFRTALEELATLRRTDAKLKEMLTCEPGREIGLGAGYAWPTSGEGDTQVTGVAADSPLAALVALAGEVK